MPLLHQFMESYVPGGETLTGDAAVEAVLTRLAEVLEAFSSAFVEMQRGMEEFGKEMGIRVGRTDSTIARARGGKELLDLLLDLRAEGRPREMSSGPTLTSWSTRWRCSRGRWKVCGRSWAGSAPTAIEAATPRSVLPMRAASLWQSFQERFHDMADDDSSLSEALFGREFARAYLGLLGRKEEPGSVSRPGRRKAPGGHKPKKGDGMEILSPSEW